MSGGDRILLEPFSVAVHIGATAAERRVAQLVWCDVELEADLARARHGDRLGDTVDYAELYALLSATARAGERVLLEALAHELAVLAAAHPRVAWAQITVRKPGALPGTVPAVRVRARRATRVAVGLGGNLGDRRANLAGGVTALARLGTLAGVSALYETEPWGLTGQPPFYNAVALLDSTLLPHALLLACKNIEREFGRTPGPRFGPRVLDLDLLTDAGADLAGPELTVPHPRLYERAFALAPLAELDSAYGAAFAALSERERAGVRRVAEWPTWGANPGA